MNFLVKTKQPDSIINQSLSYKHKRTIKVFTIAGLDVETIGSKKLIHLQFGLNVNN